MAPGPRERRPAVRPLVMPKSRSRRSTAIQGVRDPALRVLREGWPWIEWRARAATRAETATRLEGAPHDDRVGAAVELPM